jgi:hypothetical protein
MCLSSEALCVARWQKRFMRECVAGVSRPTGAQPGAFGQREVAGVGGDAVAIRNDALHRVWPEVTFPRKSGHRVTRISPLPAVG